MRDAKVGLLRILLVAAAGIVLLLPDVKAQQEAAIVLHNGKVLTVDGNFSIAQAVAIAGDRITAVGSDQDVLRQAGPHTLQIDLKGRTVIPGLIDTHLHITGPGSYAQPVPQDRLRSFRVDWRGVRNKQDVLNQIQGIMEKYKPPTGEWLEFSNQLSFMSSGRDSAEQAKILYDDLTRYDLDKVLPNNPVFLTMGIPDENLLFVNSKAIEILWGKHGDFIKKYGRYWVGSNGQPDGHLEPPATRLLLNLYWYAQQQRTPEEQAPGIQKRLEELSAAGVTTISTKMRRDGIDAYKLLEQRSQQVVRLAYGLGFDYFGSQTNPAADLKQYQNVVGTGSAMNWIISFAPSSTDGAGTRACTNQKRVGGAFGPIDQWFPVGQCHTDNEYKGGSGRAATISGNYFRDWVMSMGQYGINLANVHVSGDRTVANFLNMIEQIQKQYGPQATKNWALDHCEFVNPADLPRAAKLGVTFSCFARNLDRAGDVAEAYGEDVAHKFLSPVKSMLDAGVKVVFESDRFAGDPSEYSWFDIELFLTRKDLQGKVWGPQERVDRSSALKMITRWAAEYVLKADQLGSLEVGKLADLVVLDRDYMTIPAEDVSEIAPQMTVLGGKIVFVHSRFADEYNLRPAGAIISTYQELKARRPQAGGMWGG